MMTQRSRYSRPPVRNRFVLAFTALLLGILGVLASPTEGDPGGSEAFRSGLAALRAGRFASAVPDLAKAAQEYPLLGDYALFYLADARHNLQEHEAALTALRSLLQQYPTTILKKKARMAEIRELSDSGADSAELLAAFVKDYPDDDEAVYLYARLLKQQGAKEKAAGLFKRLYIHAGTLAETARAELDVEAISTADIIERTANLFRQYDFADAERDLRQALPRSTGALRRDLQKNLAQALFRQKKYREAADLYNRVGDAFYRARSLYRAGDPQGFTRVLQEMIAAKDPKAGYLLVAAAADKRREKDYAGALQTYEEVRKNYPAEAEDALWGIGWTHYLSGEYAEAARTFDSLYETYEDTKYLYWQARSTEADGNDASALFTRVMQTENSFYASLAFARSGKPAPQLAAAPYRPDPAREKPQGQERINALIALGMKDEAVTEIAVQCQRAASIPDLLNSAALLQDLGEYRRAIGLATRLPYSEKLHRFWYPLAFWDSVEPAAGRNRIDAFIILAVMREESRFDPAVKSPAGAYGLMQLMPATAYRLDRGLGLGVSRPAQLTNPKNNIALGAYYLKQLSDEFPSLPYALAAYNAGELAVRSWQRRLGDCSMDEFIEDIPYPETRNYVKKVLTSYFQYRRIPRPAADDSADGNDGAGRL